MIGRVLAAGLGITQSNRHLWNFTSHDHLSTRYYTAVQDIRHVLIVIKASR